MIASAAALIDEVGGTAAAAALAGVTAPAVSNWKAKGEIPPEYFFAFAEALARRGKEADRAIFGFKVLADSDPSA